MTGPSTLKMRPATASSPISSAMVGAAHEPTRYMVAVMPRSLAVFMAGAQAVSAATRMMASGWFSLALVSTGRKSVLVIG